MIGFENVVFSPYTKFDVIVVSDYNIEGSFSPNAPSDHDYYGYRETEFTVTRAIGITADEEFEFDQDELNYFIENNSEKIEVIVQNLIDKEKYND